MMCVISSFGARAGLGVEWKAALVLGVVLLLLVFLRRRLRERVLLRQGLPLVEAVALMGGRQSALRLSVALVLLLRLLLLPSREQGAPPIGLLRLVLRRVFGAAAVIHAGRNTLPNEHSGFDNPEKLSKRYHFGRLELDEKRKTLQRGGQQVKGKLM